MKIITPPNPITKNLGPSVQVFLAGSIEMGKAEDWQSKAISGLEKIEHHFAEELTIFNPRRPDWDSSWTQEFTNPQFYQQVSWELNALEQSDFIIMYFCPDTQSPISLLELGLHAKSGKLLVCCPKGFWRKGNVDIVCEKYGIPCFEDLNELLKNIN